ncbi:MAG: hypothetical protein IPJ65_06905 [Archangiaceae bacterium]|nr:hypothetical protein [Archangiaceae bacterium]
MDATYLEKTTQEFIGSLLGSKNRHTLCLNIAEPGFEAENVVKAHLDGKQPVEVHVEPDVTQFQEITGNLGGKVTVVTYSDLDHHPKVLGALLEHVKKPDPGGKLVVVSKHWNSDNTERERELRKHCLFYQQNIAPPPPEKTRK